MKEAYHISVTRDELDLLTRYRQLDWDGRVIVQSTAIEEMRAVRQRGDACGCD